MANGESSKGKSISNSKKDIECYNCHKKGHRKSNCWAKGGGKEDQGPKGKGKVRDNAKAAFDDDGALWVDDDA
jgi:hypothetical protein